MNQASTELKLYVLFQGKAASIMLDYFLYSLCRKYFSLGGEKSKGTYQWETSK